ncbi:hypothetical protein BJX65DRAFT_277239 [Aspergillus insuetus]
MYRMWSDPTIAISFFIFYFLIFFSLCLYLLSSETVGKESTLAAAGRRPLVEGWSGGLIHPISVLSARSRDLRDSRFSVATAFSHHIRGQIHDPSYH